MKNNGTKWHNKQVLWIMYVCISRRSQHQLFLTTSLVILETFLLFRLICKLQSKLREMFTQEGGVECHWDEISSLTHKQAGWFVALIAAIPNSSIWMGQCRNIGTKKLKQLTIYPLAYRAKWMKWMGATECGLPKSLNGWMRERSSVDGMSWNPSTVHENIQKVKHSGVCWGQLGTDFNKRVFQEILHSF